MSSTRREILLAGLGLLVGACRVSESPPPSPSPKLPEALPTPKLTSTKVEAVETKLGKVWEIKILPSRLGNGLKKGICWGLIWKMYFLPIHQEEEFIPLGQNQNKLGTVLR